jgi:putative ABC transport system ATP-binding protein
MIHLKNISKKFVDGKTFVTALHDINLEIKKGEFVAITGPSGSGKTSVLNLIGGLDSPTHGTISINEKDISKYSDKELSKYRNRSVGFVFQEFHLEQFLTVLENVLLPTYFNHHKKEDAHRAKELISEVGLSDRATSHTNQLSGGQKQRTAIARALINNPQIILADEPTGNLDAATGAKILEILKTLHKKHGITLVIATHDEKIASSADRIIKIKDGKIC